jgi:hypothetical protein
MRRICISIALVLFAATSAEAEGDDARDAFIEAYRCTVIEILTSIQGRNPATSRYLLLAVPNRTPSYVQCLFSPDRRQIYCEADSGFYQNKEGEPRTVFLSAEDKAKLARLGFSLDDSKGNFPQMMDVRAVGAFGRVADVLLGALYDVYGARLNTPIEAKSPFLPALGTLKPLSCPPVS